MSRRRCLADSFQKAWKLYFLLTHFHAAHTTPRQSTHITRFELKDFPDLYIVSGERAHLFKELAERIAAGDFRAIDELERIYRLDLPRAIAPAKDPTPQSKSRPAVRSKVAPGGRNTP